MSPQDNTPNDESLEREIQQLPLRAPTQRLDNRMNNLFQSSVNRGSKQVLLRKNIALVSIIAASIAVGFAIGRLSNSPDSNSSPETKSNQIVSDTRGLTGNADAPTDSTPEANSIPRFVEESLVMVNGVLMKRIHLVSRQPESVFDESSNRHVIRFISKSQVVYSPVPGV